MKHGLFRSLTLVILALVTSNSYSVDELDKIVQTFLEYNFVTAALLSDTDVIKFGVWNFNPNDYVGFEDENLGSQRSIELRNSLKQFSLPARWELSTENQDESLWLLTKAAYMELEQELQLVPSEQAILDRINEKNVLLGIGFEYERALSDRWAIEVSSYATWMRYRNKFHFNTGESRQFAPFLDDILTNIDVELLMAEPMAGVNYNWSTRSNRYQLFSSYHYMKGRYLGSEIEAHKARPNDWYWSNGFAMEKPLLKKYINGNSLWFRFSRVDVGRDLSSQLGGTYYYEAGIAWVVKTESSGRFLENVGVGLNINYGSTLEGGTLILLYNFDEFY